MYFINNSVLSKKRVRRKKIERKEPRKRSIKSNGRTCVVNFLFQVIYVFLLFLGMAMYANEVETKEKEK